MGRQFSIRHHNILSHNTQSLNFRLEKSCYAVESYSTRWYVIYALFRRLVLVLNLFYQVLLYGGG